MSALHISLPAEEIFSLFGEFPVTNSLLTSWIVMAALLLFALAVRTQIALVPGRLQSIAEIAIDGLLNLFQTILHDKSLAFFPLLGTLFLFIITMNWAGLLPGVGTIGFFHGEAEYQEFIPLFRSGTADLNLTIGLALVSMVTIQFFGLKSSGISYLKRFFNFSNPINFFVGILEFVSELSKVLSFSFRLFGNVFAGEVLLTVIAFLVPILVPIPFLGLELFVGFIQALVFSMLTAAFLSLAMAKEGH